MTLENASQRLQIVQSLIRAGDIAKASGMLSRMQLELPNHPQIHRLQGMMHARQGDAPKALQSLNKACELDPTSAPLQCDIGRLLASNGSLIAAQAHFAAATRLAPALVEGWFFTGITAIRLGDAQAGLHALRRARELNRNQRDILKALAEAEFDFGYPSDALPLWQETTEHSPDDPVAWLRLAETYSRLGDDEAARLAYQDALKQLPESADLWLAMAQCLEDTGDPSAAGHAYNQALQLRPDWARPLSGLLSMHRSKALESWRQQAKRLLSRADTDNGDKALLGYAMGKVLDSQGDHQGAMENWHAANHARRQEAGKLDREALAAHVDALVSAFDTNFFSELPDWNAADTRPIFIVGMPRSGTTLAEQILSTHSKAFGAGELPDIPLIAKQLAALESFDNKRWPESLKTFPADIINDARARYLRALGRQAPVGALKLIDKAPLNFFHLGMVATLFPGARVIWCQRDPRDIGLSIYSENFALESQFATDLGDIGFFYRQQLKLMRHWQAVLPLPIHELEYEQLTASIGQQAPALVNAAGLDWESGCLDFHANQRSVQTPSRWQVRERIHSRSVGRWQPYEKPLAPLIAELQRP